MPEQLDSQPPSSVSGRWTCARAVSCLGIAAVLAFAASIGARSLLSQAPTLALEGDQSHLVFRDGSIRVILGPGCASLASTPDWDSLEFASLTWLGEGQPLKAKVRRTSVSTNGAPPVWAAEVGDESPKQGDQVVLLPNGRSLVAPAGADFLLTLERWEGALDAARRCTIWIYCPPGGEDWLGSRDWFFDDGHDLGRRLDHEEGRGGGEGWEIGETYASGSREFKVGEGKDFGTYVLETAGKTYQVVLERTYQGEWSAGDGLPE